MEELFITEVIYQDGKHGTYQGTLEEMLCRAGGFAGGTTQGKRVSAVRVYQHDGGREGNDVFMWSRALGCRPLN